MNATPTTPQDRILAGQALVYSLASKIHRTLPAKVELDDLVGYGELGLAEAARDFDDQLGCQFSTFAYYRIRGAIYDGLGKMAWTSRRHYNRIKAAQMSHEVLAAPDPSAESNETSAAENANWLGGVTDQLTVVQFASHEDSGGIRDSTIADPGQSASAIVAQTEIGQKLREAVNQLPEQERRLVSAVYFEGATLQAAGAELGMSKSWASRLHARALEKLALALRRLGADSASDG